MLYWLLMMIIMVIISHNDKLQMVSPSCVRRLIQTMIWLTVSEFYQTVWPLLLRRAQAHSQLQQAQQVELIRKLASFSQQVSR